MLKQTTMKKSVKKACSGQIYTFHGEIKINTRPGQSIESATKRAEPCSIEIFQQPASALSGCPKGHRDFTEAKCQRHFGRLQAIRMLTLEPERLKNQRTTTRRRSPEMEGALHRRRSSGLRLQFRNVEIFPLLP